MISGTGNKGKTAQGFTLIEVLVATVILFAGLAAVLGAYSSAVTALDRSTDVLAATQILQEQAAALSLAAGPDRRGLASGAGSCEGLSFRYEWSVTCQRILTPGGVSMTEAVITAGRANQQGGCHSLVSQWSPVEEGAAR